MKYFNEDFFKLFDQLGEKILETYDKVSYKTNKKTDNSYVTSTDLVADKIIQDFLQKISPYPIISEEKKNNKNIWNNQKIWIIDPIDGTLDFIQKTDNFSVMIALMENKTPIEAYVYIPTEKKTFYAHKGKGAFMYCHQNKKHTLCKIDHKTPTKFLISRNHTNKQDIQVLNKLDCYKEENIIKCGSVGVKTARIIQNQGTVYINFTNKISYWDVCPNQLLINEAGGYISDITGQDISYDLEDNFNMPRGVIISAKKSVLQDLINANNT